HQCGAAFAELSDIVHDGSDARVADETGLAQVERHHAVTVGQERVEVLVQDGPVRRAEFSFHSQDAHAFLSCEGDFHVWVRPSKPGRRRPAGYKHCKSRPTEWTVRGRTNILRIPDGMCALPFLDPAPEAGLVYASGLLCYLLPVKREGAGRRWACGQTRLNRSGNGHAGGFSRPSSRPWA